MEISSSSDTQLKNIFARTAVLKRGREVTSVGIPKGFRQTGNNLLACVTTPLHGVWGRGPYLNAFGERGVPAGRLNYLKMSLKKLEIKVS